MQALAFNQGRQSVELLFVVVNSDTYEIGADIRTLQADWVGDSVSEYPDEPKYRLWDIGYFGLSDPDGAHVCDLADQDGLSFRADNTRLLYSKMNVDLKVDFEEILVSDAKLDSINSVRSSQSLRGVIDAITDKSEKDYDTVMVYMNSSAYPYGGATTVLSCFVNVIPRNARATQAHELGHWCFTFLFGSEDDNVTIHSYDRVTHTDVADKSCLMSPNGWGRPANQLINAAFCVKQGVIIPSEKILSIRSGLSVLSPVHYGDGALWVYTDEVPYKSNSWDGNGGAYYVVSYRTQDPDGIFDIAGQDWIDVHGHDDSLYYDKVYVHSFNKEDAIHTYVEAILDVGQSFSFNNKEITFLDITSDGEARVYIEDYKVDRVSSKSTVSAIGRVSSEATLTLTFSLSDPDGSRLVCLDGAEIISPASVFQRVSSRGKIVKTTSS